MNPERRAEIEAFAAGGGRDMRALTETLAALAEAERERDTVRTDTHDALAAAEARSEAAERAMRLLEGLTPGGSEYFNNPQRCATWVEDRLRNAQRMTVDAVARRKDAEQDNARLRAELETANALADQRMRHRSEQLRLNRSLRQQLAAAEARAEAAERERDAWKADSESLSARLRSVRESNERLSEKLAGAERDTETLISERDSLRAELASARAVLLLAEKNCRSHFVADGEGVSICRICDQPDDHTRTSIDHAPDCPFAALAATPARPGVQLGADSEVVAPESGSDGPISSGQLDMSEPEPWCTVDRHIVLPSGEACQCGENRTERML